ncbi:MAG: Crp/Fnr family transcriptional regulator [Bacteroidota bacterium]
MSHPLFLKLQPDKPEQMRLDIELHQSTIRKRIQTNAPIPIADALISAYLDILKFKWVKKKQYLVQPGFPNQDQIYVVEGAFRAFFLDREGKEQTIQFAIEDWFISDTRSYLTGEPASMFIEALENSVIALLPKAEFEALCDAHPTWQKVSRILTQHGFAYAQKRMMSNLQKSAEERYLDFAKNYAAIEQRVPRHALASFLNMSQEYLSKIRKKLMEE